MQVGLEKNSLEFRVKRRYI